MKTTVTKKNQENAREFFHITAKDSKDKPVKCRRNGKTKTWKTRPTEFKIPVKYGMYDYFYIDQNNCKEWEVEI